MELGGTVYKAKLENSSLIWNDGDVWAKASPCLQQHMRNAQEELEVWKHQAIGHISLRPREHLREAAGELLRGVPSNHFGPCDRMRRVVVTHVEEVHNTSKWKKYAAGRQTLKELLRNRQNCPGVKDIAPVVERLSNSFPYID